MAKQINYLTLSYPNFTLGQVINPDEANQNNSDIANKVNEFVDEVKEALDIADGARITATNADTKSNSANTTANNAVSTANGAVNTANNAVSTANTALTNANNAVSTATSVQTEFNTLKPTLEQAIVDANNAIAEIDNVLEGTVFDRVGTVVGRGAFVATQDGVTTFTLPVASYNPLYDDLQVFYKGFPLELNDNYTMSGRDIILTFELKTGESIVYRTVKNIIINPTLTDGAFIKPGSVIKATLDQEVIDWVDSKANQNDLSTLEENINNVKMDKEIQDDSNGKKYEFGFLNGELYYREVI